MFKEGVLLISLALSLTGQLNAQCRTFARNECENQLEDYIANGRMYGGYMIQGQESEINLVLNGGQKYRLISCTKPTLGNVWIQLLDSKGNVLFDNSEHEFASRWDFSVKSTQEFKIKTFIANPEKSSAMKIRECSVLIFGSKSAT